MHYRLCRPIATIITGAVPYVVIHARNGETAGLMLAAGTNLERISERLYIANLNSGLHGRGVHQKYTFDAAVHGDLDALRRVVQMVNNGGLFAHHDSATKALVAQAIPTCKIAPKNQWKLHLDVRTVDEALIVKRVAEVVLTHKGTFHHFAGETENSGRNAGTADFVIDAQAGFPTHADAERAVDALIALGFDETRVTRLYDEVRGGLSIAA